MPQPLLIPLEIKLDRVAKVFVVEEGRTLAQCEGTNQVLEDALVNGGSYEVTCALASGGNRTFNVRNPVPPPPDSGKKKS